MLAPYPMKAQHLHCQRSSLTFYYPNGNLPLLQSKLHLSSPDSQAARLPNPPIPMNPILILIIANDKKSTRYLTSCSVLFTRHISPSEPSFHRTVTAVASASSPQLHMNLSTHHTSPSNPEPDLKNSNSNSNSNSS